MFSGCSLLIISPPGAAAKYCDECLSVCLSVREDISETTRAIFTNFLCVLLMSVAWSSSGTLTIGRIACRREEGDGSAQRGRSVMMPCFNIASLISEARQRDRRNCCQYLSHGC